MRIAIAGAGIAGSYLYRLLKETGHEPDLFETGSKTHCHIRPCAWGSSAEFLELVEAIGLRPEDYVLKRFDRVEIESIVTGADLLTFDKPKLLADMQAGALIATSPPKLDSYDRVIDATGLARAYLPPVEGDLVAPCVQCRIETAETEVIQIKGVSIGYAWSFPISSSETHLGCGSLALDPRKALKELDWLDGHALGDHAHAVCACHSAIRLSGPAACQPFVTGGRVWGVGEAIGCVSPLVADGIVSSMRSGRVLLQCWDDPELYTQTILETFGWMEPERNVLDQLLAGQRVSLRDALTFSTNLRRMGIRLSVDQAIQILRSISAIPRNGEARADASVSGRIS